MTSKVPIKLLHPDAKVPVYSSELAAGCDFYSVEEVVVWPDEVIGLKPKDLTKGLAFGEDLVETSFNDPDAIKLHIVRHPAVVSTGVAVQLGSGEELEIRGRSGLGFKHNVQAFNGTIDADFTGEIKVKIWNLGSDPFIVQKGMRIAQGVIKKVLRKEFDSEVEFRETSRGESGYGSTGL